MALTGSSAGNKPPAANQIQPDWKQEAGPLRKYLNDPSVSEIMVNRYDRLFIERNGLIEEIDARFDSVEAVNRFVQSMAVYVGKEINRRSPFLEARLPDGSRLNAVLSPVALDGPSISIRKFSTVQVDSKGLVNKGTLSQKALYFLSQLIIARQNIIISGGTGSGKTTLLNAISSFISSRERVVTIEDTAELQINSKNIVRLESKIALHQETEVTVQDLLKSSLRMRPDRIIIGECRGAEAWDMLMAMNTGHAGSLTTLHANTAFDALRRLEAMVLRSDVGVPLDMIKKDIGRTINFIIQVERSADGVRRIVQISEVLEGDAEGYQIRDIFTYSPMGGLESLGVTPRFVKDNSNPKIKMDDKFFHPNFKVKLEGMDSPDTTKAS